MDARIREYSAWEPASGGARWVSYYMRRKAWILSRRSPPRCLSCYGTDVIILPLGRRVPHPEGSGWITVGVAGFASPVNFGEWILTPEGEPYARPDPQPDRGADASP
jgi:hypothetical protein